MKFFKEHSVFIFILLVCAILRLIPLFDYQFTYDELSGLERTQFDSFSEVMEKGVKIDAHPALVQLLIYYLTQCFGYVTWIIKLPFLLFGFGAIIYAYLFGLRHFSKQSGLFSAVLFSFSLVFVFYAPIARMYISGIFFSIALLFYFFELVFLNNLKWSNYFLFGLFALLSALNQHINALFAFTVCASGLLFIKKESYKAYLVTCALVVLAYLPHLTITLYQLGVGGIGREQGGWLEVPELSVLFTFVKILFGTGITYLLILALVIFSAVLKRKTTMTKKQLYLIFLFVINFLIVFLYSLWRFPIFQNSVMLFSGVALIIFVSSFIEFKNSLVFYSIFFAMMTVLLYKSYVKKDYLHQAVKTVFEYQFERTVHYKRKYGNTHVYPVFFDADAIMKKIYFKKYHTHFECKISSDSLISNMEQVSYEKKTGDSIENKVSSLRLFSEFVSKLNCDYIVLSSAMPLHQAVVRQYFPYLIENTQTQAINYKVYSRKMSDASLEVADDKQNYFSSITQAGSFVFSKKEQVQITGSGFSLRVDSLNEFPFDAKAALADITTKEGEVVLVETKVKLANPKSELEACISVTDKSSNESYNYNSKNASDFVCRPDSSLTLYTLHFNGTNYHRVKYLSSLNCYLWNKGKEKLELQNFTIKVIDYWPQKWHFWD